MNAIRLATTTKSLLLSAICLIAYAPYASSKQVAGLWDSSGSMLLPTEYDEIRRVGDTFIARESHIDEDGRRTLTEFKIDKTGKRLTEALTISGQPPAPDTREVEPKVKMPRGWKLESNFEFGCTITNAENQRAFVDSDGNLTMLPSDCPVEPVAPGFFLKRTYPSDGGETLALLGAELKPIAILPKNIQLLNSHFTEGLLKVRTEDGAIGFLNTKGVFHIKPSTINDAEDFKHGICKVQLITHGGNAAAIIDKDGRIVAGPYENAEFPYISRDSDQVVVEFDRQRAGVVTTFGKVIIPFEYDFILEYDDKYIGRRDGQWSVFSHDGKVIRAFPKTVCNIEPLGKLWKFSIGGDASNLENTFRGNPYPGSKTGLMDASGRVVIPAKYRAIAGEMSGSLVLFSNSNSTPHKWGVLNVDTGKVVLEPQFETISLQDGFIFVFENRDSFEPWQSGRGSIEGWQAFLCSFDLIGMKKSKVEQLLGVPHRPSTTDTKTRNARARYILSSTCTGSTGIEIEYDSKEEAAGWRDFDDADAGPWIRGNFVFIPKGNSEATLLIPKSEYRKDAERS